MQIQFLKPAILIAASVICANASFVVDVTQQGQNVLATAYGTIDTHGLQPLKDVYHQLPEVDPAQGAFLIGIDTTGVLYSGLTPGIGFGKGAATVASQASGDGIFIDGMLLGLPSGYRSGERLDATDLFLDTTLVKLGLTDSVYTWSWGSGKDADSLTLRVGPFASTPEPATAGLLLGVCGIAAFGVRRKLRRTTGKKDVL